jgi:predicted nuclease of predicted toxin-antitoxin system
VKIMIDMNLGASWERPLRAAGHAVTHWSEVGDANAPDTSIMAWAKAAGHVVLTADLDFGGHLVRSRDDGPSVVQLRTAVTVADAHGDRVLQALRAHEGPLAKGALVTINEDRVRVRLLASTQPN